MSKHEFCGAGGLALRKANCGLALLLSVLLWACGDGSTTQDSDAGAGRDGGTTSTDLAVPSTSGPFPATLPQVVPTLGAISQPHIVPVFFPNNTLKTSLTNYVMNYVARSTAYAPLAEYGITNTTVGTAVQLAAAPPLTVSDTDVQTLLAARIGDGTLPAADGRSIYLLFYPQATSISKGTGKSCQEFAGYHGWTKVSGFDVPYCVIPQCTSATAPGALAALTIATSHEITEAVTDPVGISLFDMNDPYPLWFAPFYGNEVADMCEWLSDSAVTELGIGTSARVWSNAAMRAKKNPCLPAPGGAPSFFAIPIMPDQRAIQINNVIRQAEVVTLIGTTPRTIDVNLISDGSAGVMITAEAEEVPISTSSVPNPAKVLTFTWQEAPTAPRVTASSGSKVHLQLQASSAPTSGYTTFRVYATITVSGSVKTQTMWAGQVNIR
jgi:hypothetical protein